METITSGMLVAILAPIVIYFTIAAALIRFGKPKKPAPGRRLDFKELFLDYKNLPPLKTFTAGDGKPLAYRHYPADSDKVLILLHGSGWHSQYFLPLAGFISTLGLAQVYTPDLRGHGPAPERRGDVDTIGQLEDDLAAFIAMIRKTNSSGTLILGGHSSGGGLAVRFAASPYGRQADAYVLLCPYLQYNAPTIRPDSDGWASPNIGRIIGLTLLNHFGIRWFNGLKVIEFNLPKEARNGTETLSYSYRLNVSLAPGNYQKDLGAITQPLLVVVGSADEVFFAEQFEPVFSRYTKGSVKLLNGVTHMGIAVGPEVRPVLKEWLEGLGKISLG